MSRGFVSTLIGIALTIVAWFGPWLWPGLPAVTVLDFVLARAGWSVVPFGVKAVGMVALIIINVGFWAVVTWVVLWATRRVSSPPPRSA